ncbi:hypothetical protein INR49_008161 [Caranx melampygus]|nr:hypothetical protein INR49_008161 [Caranx melampygus]
MIDCTSASQTPGALRRPELLRGLSRTRHANSGLKLERRRPSSSFIPCVWSCTERYNSQSPEALYRTLESVCSDRDDEDAAFVRGPGSVRSGFREKREPVCCLQALLNRYAVEGRDLTLQNIYNVGSSAALEVELSDDSFPPEDFGIVSGMLNVKWDRIAPNIQSQQRLPHGGAAPPEGRVLYFTSASVSYLAQEGGQVVVGYTSAPGREASWLRGSLTAASPHIIGVVCYAMVNYAGLGCFWRDDSASIGIPLLLWYSSKRKYDSPKARRTEKTPLGSGVGAGVWGGCGIVGHRISE